MVTAVEHGKGGIEISVTLVDVCAYKVSQPDTLVGHRTFGYVVTEQADAEAVGRINVAEVVALSYILRIKFFKCEPQFGCAEEVLQKILPFIRVKR